MKTVQSNTKRLLVILMGKPDMRLLCTEIMNSNHQVKGKLGTNWCLLFVINPILGGTQQSFIWVVYIGGVGGGGGGLHTP